MNKKILYRRSMMMNIVDWFDVNNLEHLKAYKHLGETGVWPTTFIPNFVEMGTLWYGRITSKIADEFVNKMLNNID